MLLQSGNLLEHLSVAQNIRAAQALVGKEPAGQERRGHPEPGTGGDARAGGRSRPDGQVLLDDVGLGERASARPSTLSGGESARAGLAVAMANDPPVLLADEPTGEVDRQAEAQVLELLRGRADRGKAVLVVTHSERVAASADRIVRMVDGRITDE
jgi:putative ABC transport system ATP-binding protein